MLDSKIKSPYDPEWEHKMIDPKLSSQFALGADIRSRSTAENSAAQDEQKKKIRDLLLGGPKLQENPFRPSNDIALGGTPSKPTNTLAIKDPTHLGAFIKSIRKSKKLTQQQLADLAGVGRRFLVECEAGKPRLEFAKVLQVAAAAGIDIFATKR
jgi:y4mF family transcriptional regulator